MAGEENSMSKATRARLPAYLRYLKGESAKGIAFVSSSVIARDMGYTAVGVRKDLALASSVPGKPRLGFEVKQLITDIEKFLGYHRWTDAIVVGIGGLGKAMLSYEGFENYGIHVIAGFDSSPSKVGGLGGKSIYPIERMASVVKHHKVKVGILTVPRESAQVACDEMVEAGITAILNFAPVYLNVPESVTVKYEDLAVSLAELCGQI